MRRYYTDPLAAAWMAKHFGMQFEWVDVHGGAPLDFDDLVYEIHNRYVKQFLIHPDSLPLLEPLKGDVVLTTIDGTICKITNTAEAGNYMYNHHRAVHALDRDNVVSIIQRNGQAFFWPESEAV